MKKLILLLIIMALISCVDQSERLKNLKSMYPDCIVEPATGLISHQGYQFIIIDSTNQIVAVSFYPFSSKKISSFRNVR